MICILEIRENLNTEYGSYRSADGRFERGKDIAKREQIGKWRWEGDMEEGGGAT